MFHSRKRAKTGSVRCERTKTGNSHTYEPDPLPAFVCCCFSNKISNVEFVHFDSFIILCLWDLEIDQSELLQRHQPAAEYRPAANSS